MRADALRRHSRPGIWIAAVTLLPVIAAALAPAALTPFDPWAAVAPPLLPPSPAHPFGTDDVGRDLLSAVIAGARPSLAIGLAVSVLALTIGAVVGVLAGLLGGWTDDALMRLAEIVQVVPRFFVAILVAALFGPSLAGLALVLGLTAWPGLARIARAETLALSGQQFVRAALALGGGKLWVVRRHILPNAIQPVLAALAILVSGAILTEAGLAYLGLSDPNVMSWGRLISSAQPFLHRAWWMSLFPGLAIVLTVMPIALLADAVRQP